MAAASCPSRSTASAEIAWWLAGYANHVKVLKPALLRDRMIQMHRAALEIYHPSHPSPRRPRKPR